MNGRLSPRLLLLVVAALAGSPGCDGTPSSTATPPGGRPAGGATPATATATAAAPAAAAEPGHFTGRITFADGSPITVPGVEYRITIAGVTAVGENNTFTPEVGPDGTFKLRLPQGLFKPAYGTITVPFEGKKYSLWIDPVNPVKATRESAPGIVQNFVWRLTGPRPGVLNPDVNNATHWFGSTIPLIASTFREDIQQAVKPLADGSKITWTLKPISKLLDGSEGKPLTVERTWRGGGSSFDALNDLPPASYQVSAVATLPDGSTKPLLLTDLEDRRYKPTAKLVLEPYENLSHYVYLPRNLSWAVE
jgi:hypothetical protein